jgi:tetratricopeptide (TPR) repeat protein
LGLLLAEQGKLKDAIACFREAIRVKPSYATGHNDLGTALKMQGQLNEAITHYREAIRREPVFALAHFNLGTARVDQEKYDEAIRCYREAIRLKPDYAAAHNNLAWLRATCPNVTYRDPREALSHAKTLIKLAPGDGGAWNTLGVAQYCNGEWKAAIEALTKSIRLHKGGESLDFFFLAMAYWQLGDKEKARTRYDQAVAWMDKNKPQDKELSRLRAEAAALLGLEKAAQTQKK